MAVAFAPGRWRTKGRFPVCNAITVDHDEAMRGYLRPTITLEPFDFSRVPACSGIYFLARGDKTVYVGCSKGMAWRVWAHVRDGKKRFDHFAHIEVPEEYLLPVEGFYILLLDPIYNDRILPAHEHLERLVERARRGELW